MRKTIWILAIASLFFCRLSSAAEWKAKVVDVIDCSVIRVTHGKLLMKIQLLGIACPHQRQPFSEPAKQFTRKLLLGQTVLIKSDPISNLTPIFAEVLWQKEDVVEVLRGDRVEERRVKTWSSVGEALVKAGLAWWDRNNRPDDRRMADFESAAKQAKRGLWSEANPIPPWEWSRNKLPGKK